MPAALTFEQIEPLPPEPLAIELLRRLPEHQPFKRASAVAGLLRDAGPKPPELVMTASYDDDVLASRRSPSWRLGNSSS